MKQQILSVCLLLLTVFLLLTGCDFGDVNPSDGGASKPAQKQTQAVTEQEKADSPILVVGGFASVEGIPDYAGNPYVILNNNQPSFTQSEIKTESYEFYSPLDSLGRCGVTHACVGKDIMPTDNRESISSVKPRGWVNNEYDADLVDGRYVYNRCHLIGFQLTGENANKENLITGTRYMNVDGMLPFENLVADYVKETENHVMYRVTPIFVGNNLVASGCQLEAWSVEDNGAGVCFNVFVYNVQPGITINYLTGENWLSTKNDETITDIQTEGIDSSEINTEETYILNTNGKTIHRPSCSSVDRISAANKKEHTGSTIPLLAQGYKPCGNCMQ